RVWRRLLENSLSAKVSCWLIRLLILGSGYNTMISHLGLIRTFPLRRAQWNHHEGEKPWRVLSFNRKQPV
ncbi:hypothetical protein, partial [Enterobacter cloacae complex sp. IR5422]|uniref:hypothetical protein n=1 Tax=Enterobacter cloacae complex sp. IR5422 TaxID=3412363 RepID=UPI003B9EA9F7